MRLFARRSGMTLIEVIVSIAVSAILVLAAYAVYAAAVDGWNTSRRRIDMQQRARISLDMMAKCIRAAAVTDDEDSFVFEGENIEVEEPTSAPTDAQISLPAQDILTLRTNASLYLPGDKEAPDQTKIQFFLEVPDPNAVTAVDAAAQPLSFKMKIDPNFDADTAETGYVIELAEGIDSLNFRYFSGTSWDDQWTSSQGAPRSVEITIMVRDLEGKTAPQTYAITAPVECWRPLELKKVSAPPSDPNAQPDQTFKGYALESPPQPEAAQGINRRGSNAPAGSRVRP